MKTIHLGIQLIFVAIIAITSSYGAGARSPFRAANEGSINVVVIDPGHGGRDAGTSSGSTEEKDIVLKIALNLGEYIEREYPGIKVIYTRQRDVFIPLYKRAEIANKADADLFISIHVNSVPQRSVFGTETFVLGQHRSDDNLEVAKKENAVILLEDDYTATYEGFDPNLPESYIMFELVQDEYKEQSILLANEIQNEFRVHAKRSDRSVKEAGFLVLRQTAMPGVLIETGFLSNANERKYLTSLSGQDEIAASIFRAFSVYKDEIDKRSSFAWAAEKQDAASDEKDQAMPINKEVRPEASDAFFSVQIIALSQKREPTPENFNGLTDVFGVDGNSICRYFSGKFESYEKAEAHQKAVQEYYKQAYVVGFWNNELISAKKLLEYQK